MFPWDVNKQKKMCVLQYMHFINKIDDTSVELSTCHGKYPKYIEQDGSKC